MTEGCEVTRALELSWHNMNKQQRKKRENNFLTTATLYYLSSPVFVFKAVRSASIFRRLTVVEMTLECLYMPLQSRRRDVSSQPSLRFRQTLRAARTIVDNLFVCATVFQKNQMKMCLLGSEPMLFLDFCPFVR